MITAVLLCSTAIVTAQKQNANWYFGLNCGFHFGSSGINVTSGCITSLAQCATISDTAGNLLLATDGVRIYNKNGNIISHADSLDYFQGFGNNYYYGSSRTNNSIFLPGFNDSTYFMFNVHNTPLPMYGWEVGLAYAKIIVKPDTQYLELPKLHYFYNNSDSGFLDKIAVVKHANGRDWWLYAHGGSSNRFIRFLLTPTGLQGPFFQNIGSSIPQGYGEINISKDGSKLVSATSFIGYLELFSIDRCTGLLYNFIDLGNTPHDYNVVTGFYSACFSPDGTKLYAGGTNIYQYDLNSSNPKQTETIIYSDQNYLLGQDSAAALGQMELGIDGKIYQTTVKRYFDIPFNGVASLPVKYLNVIENPNQLYPACNYHAQAIYMNGNILTNGLPNTVNYALGKLIGSACDTICNITAQTEAQQQTICSGDSALIYGVYQKVAGVYGDTLHTYNQCDSIYSSTTLTVETVDATVTENNKTLIAHLIPIAIGTTYQWYSCDSSINITGATQQTFTPTHTGNYACKITSNGCTATSNCKNVITSTYDLPLTTYNFSIYPNPTHDEVHIESDFAMEEIIITDMLGRKLLEVKNPSLREGFRMGLFASGVYIVEVKMKNGESVKRKLVKE